MIENQKNIGCMIGHISLKRSSPPGLKRCPWWWALKGSRTTSPNDLLPASSPPYIVRQMQRQVWRDVVYPDWEYSYIYIYMYMCVYIYMCIYIYLFTYVYAYLHAYMFIYIIYIYLFIYINIHRKYVCKLYLVSGSWKSTDNLLILGAKFLDTVWKCWIKQPRVSPQCTWLTKGSYEWEMSVSPFIIRFIARGRRHCSGHQLEPESNVYKYKPRITNMRSFDPTGIFHLNLILTRRCEVVAHVLSSFGPGMRGRVWFSI